MLYNVDKDVEIDVKRILNQEPIQWPAATYWPRGVSRQLESDAVKDSDALNIHVPVVLQLRDFQDLPYSEGRSRFPIGQLR